MIKSISAVFDRADAVFLSKQSKGVWLSAPLPGIARGICVHYNSDVLVMVTKSMLALEMFLFGHGDVTLCLRLN